MLLEANINGIYWLLTEGANLYPSTTTCVRRFGGSFILTRLVREFVHCINDFGICYMYGMLTLLLDEEGEHLVNWRKWLHQHDLQSHWSIVFIESLWKSDDMVIFTILCEGGQKEKGTFRFIGATR